MIEMLSPTPADSQPTTANVDEASGNSLGVPGELPSTTSSPNEPPAPGPVAQKTRSWSLPVTRVAAMAIVLMVLCWSYATNLRFLFSVWNRDPNYSHGFLVVPVALFILWRRWVEGSPPPLKPSLWGWVGLVGVLVARAICYERGSEWSETATLLPVIACLTLTVGGGPLLRRVWPAIAFLVFLFPLPQSINSLLSQPLQRLATVGSCILLKLTGLWVVAEGNVILVGADPLEVAAACNGLSMLMCLAATVAAMTCLVPMAVWKRVVLMASIIPVALVSNILRIAATAWCYHMLGATSGAHFAHDAAGWLMMPVALILVGLELALLSWLVVTEEEISGKQSDHFHRLHTRTV